MADEEVKKGIHFSKKKNCFYLSYDIIIIITHKKKKFKEKSKLLPNFC